MARFRPSPAMVVACAALFVALGGVATGAVVITSNSQVAQDTISGHKPPSGDHSNVIAGSVNGQDVANDSLTGAKINESTLTGGARRLDYHASLSGPTTIANVGPYAIKGECSLAAGVRLLVNGPAGTADIMWSRVRNDSTDLGDRSDGKLVPANTDTQLLALGTVENSYDRAGGRAILRSGSTLVQIDFEATADATSGADCFIYGTATKAT